MRDENRPSFAFAVNFFFRETLQLQVCSYNAAARLLGHRYLILLDTFARVV
jgi:hypothetical protein